MKKVLKRILASLLVVVMIFIAEPLSGFVGMELKLDWLAFTPKASAAQYVFPVTGGHSISQYFSSSHGAIDVANCAQQPVVATATGTVIRVDNNCQHTNYSKAGCTAEHNKTCGNCVYIKHDGTGYVSVYGHLYPNSICVSVGQKVQAGQQLGLVGSSGMSTGYHLHFEIRPYADNYNNWERDSENINVNPEACSYIYLDSPSSSTSKPEIKIDKIDNNIVKIHWNDTGASSYYIYVDDLDNKVVVPNTSYNCGKVFEQTFQLPNGNYRVYVSAIYGDGSVNSSNYTFSLIGQSSPTVSVRKTNYDSFDVSWNDTFASSYYVYVQNVITGESVSNTGYNIGRNLNIHYQLSEGLFRVIVSAVYDDGVIKSGLSEEFQLGKLSPSIEIEYKDDNIFSVYWNDTFASSYYIYIDDLNNKVVVPNTSYDCGKDLEKTFQLSNGSYRVYVSSVYDDGSVKSSSKDFSLPKGTLYTIVFNDNGGSGIPLAQTKSYGTDLILSSAKPIKQNYNFIEWNTKPDGTGVSYQPGDTYSENADLTLYAIWELDHEHEYISEITQQPTCTEKGIKAFTCSLCDDVYYEDVDELGHDYVACVTEPTCTEQGFTTYECSRCDDSYTENYIEPLNHSSSSWHTAINPTATSEGLAEKLCDYCGIVLDQFTIPCLAPDYVTGITLSSEKETVKIGDTFTLSATVIPDTAKNKNVIWSSRNPEIVSVDNGKVTAIKPGTTAIVVETEDGGYIDFCLVRVISLVAFNGAVIDNDRNIIYGLSSNLESVDDYLKTADDSMTVNLSTSTVGTGTFINVMDNGEVVDLYEAVIFGDVNGDSWYDGQDAIIVDCLANGMLTKEYVGEAVYTAADCNHDGVIDLLDVAILNEAGTLLANVDQSKPTEVLLETSSEYVEYLELIDQSPEIEDEKTEGVPEVDVESEDTTPEQGYAEVNIFEMIINFIKSIFELLFTYIPVPIN